MVICPKCGFDQPPDRYCASCGVDLDNYKGKRKSTFRPAPLVFLGIAIALILVTVFFIDKLKTWDLGKFYPESEIIDTQTSTNFGTSSDLQLQADEVKTTSDTRLAAPKTLGGMQGAPPATKPESGPPANFKNAPVTFIIGEITDVEINQLIVTKDTATEPDPVVWGVSDDIPLIRRDHIERDMKFNFGENKVNYEDELIHIDVGFEITSVTDSTIKAKVRYNRNLAGIQTYANDEQASFDITVPMQKTVYIVDRLPRVTQGRNEIAATNSLLGQLYKSRTFREETSEVVLLIQFE